MARESSLPCTHMYRHTRVHTHTHAHTTRPVLRHGSEQMDRPMVLPPSSQPPPPTALPPALKLLGKETRQRKKRGERQLREPIWSLISMWL